LLVDGKGGNFEDVLTRLFVKIDQLSLNINHIGEFQQRIREQLRLAVQKKAMVRFNPFEDAGGDQSFALVLLDEKDNGVILSSLHGRGTTRMYAKHIEGGKSPHQLTEEEKAVLAEAIGKK